MYEKTPCVHVECVHTNTGIHVRVCILFTGFFLICVCGYIHIYMYTRKTPWVYTDTLCAHRNTCIRICVCMCVYIYTCIHIFLKRQRVYIQIYICVCIYLHIHADCTCGCVDVWMYACVYIHIYMHGRRAYLCACKCLHICTPSLRV